MVVAVGRKSHTEDYWNLLAPDHLLRCSGHYKSTGERCRREAIPGGTVCEKHGGLAPVVRERAATRIGLSVDDAVKKLLAMVEDPDVPARDKIKVLHDLLDRGGLGSTSKHMLGVVAGDSGIDRMLADLLASGQGTVPRDATPDEIAALLGTATAETEDYEALEARYYSEPEAVDAEWWDEPAEQVLPPRATTPQHIRRGLDL